MPEIKRDFDPWTRDPENLPVDGDEVIIAYRFKEHVLVDQGMYTGGIWYDSSMGRREILGWMEMPVWTEKD